MENVLSACASCFESGVGLDGTLWFIIYLLALSGLLTQ